MDNRINRFVTWGVAIGVLSLIINHASRGLNYIPLTLLLIPVIGLIATLED